MHIAYKLVAVLIVIAMIVSAANVWSIMVPTNVLSVKSTETVELRYDGEVLEVEVPVDYIQLPTVRAGFPNKMALYVLNDPVAEQIADWIDDNYGDSSDLKKVSIATEIVATNIEYEDDYPYFDHYKLPWETVRDGTGDCEDYSMLLVSILQSLGIDSVMLISLHHMSVGVAVDTTGHHATYHGKDYYIVEPQYKAVPGKADQDIWGVIEPGWGIWVVLELIFCMAMLWWGTSLLRRLWEDD